MFASSSRQNWGAIALLSMRLLFALVVLSCGSPTQKGTALVTGGRDVVTGEGGTIADIKILADPQFHNVYGGLLRTLSPFTDSVAPVAIRPSLLNLLNPLVFEAFVNQTQQLSSSPFLFVLGDGGNIGCAAEFEEMANTFEHALQSAGFWLMAHGNHDSYMAGTDNHWGPADSESSEFLERIRGREFDLPVSFEHPERFAWRDAMSARRKAYGPERPRSWEAACAVPAAIPERALGVPANKLVWMAQYMRHLEKDGELTFAPDAGRNDRCAEGAGQAFHSTTRAQTLLDDHAFWASGCWVPPTIRCNEPYFTQSWSSFIVQSLRLSDRLWVLLADTSVADQEITTGLFNFGKAGSHGRIGPEELAQLVDHARRIAGVDPGSRVLLLTHFPADQVDDNELDAVVQTLGTIPGVAVDTLVSAHTHDPSHLVQHGRYVEYNVGSTVDWPMESMVLGAAASAYRDQFTVLTMAADPPLHSSRFGDRGRMLLVQPAARADHRGDYSRTGRLGTTSLRFVQVCAHAQSLVAVGKWLRDSRKPLVEREDYARCDVAQQQQLLLDLTAQVGRQTPCDAATSLLERVACYTAIGRKELIERARSDSSLLSALLGRAAAASQSERPTGCNAVRPRQRLASKCKASAL
jgi:hypothetical protein